MRYDREPKRKDPPRRVIKSNDLDPMDPAAYSDISRYSSILLYSNLTFLISNGF